MFFFPPVIPLLDVFCCYCGAPSQPQFAPVCTKTQLYLVVDKTASLTWPKDPKCICEWVQSGRVKQPSAVTRLHMVIRCTCGSGIGGLWWSELPPTHIHPIPFIRSECGSPFTLLSQRREHGGGVWGWEQGRRDWGLRGREVVFLSLLAQREGKTIGVQMDASPLFLDDLPLPSFVPPSHLSIHPFCSLGMFERRDTVVKRGSV